ncbi:MAG: porin family protein [Burkholderiales bacterium]|nr:porin family protein [Burkholderiales bacterium]
MPTPISLSLVCLARRCGGLSATALRALLASLPILAASAASAGEISAGAGFSASHGKGRCVDSFPCDRSSGGGKVFGSYRFDDAWDVQAVYFGGHSFKGGDTTPLGTEFGGTFKVSGAGLTAGYRWTFAPAWSLTGRAGVAAVRTRFDYADYLELDSAGKSTAQPLAGLRLAWQASPQVSVGIDYDVTRFKVHTTRGSLQVLGLAAQFTF